jgi:hypothetical protein
MISHSFGGIEMTAAQTRLTYAAIALFATISICRADTFTAGPGAFTCGKFANEYLRNPVLTEGVYFTWAQGFMSAMNMVNASEGGDGRKFYHDLEGPFETQKSKLRAYCNAHPLSYFVDAEMDLLGSLPVKPMQPK